ncbi:hypothetical protein QS306_12435 [Paraburkholderia bonniea]|uniref:hypothetical protein n=1 Tax=Paraburkholderia bonniea TaxID=2152891 RepID=UPI001292A6CC|nr:hypothetical protein [Paraburkholderia bonniea]WJF89900.1 hypothetical protein QS306_12435 [Paraburkholderia bonniea]WJF93214.1 hypothetical protein QS308_12445 [Paraburkholderia bonniea]
MLFGHRSSWESSLQLKPDDPEKKRGTIQAGHAIQTENTDWQPIEITWSRWAFDTAARFDAAHCSYLLRVHAHDGLNKVLYEGRNANRKQELSSAKSFNADEKMVQTVLN